MAQLTQFHNAPSPRTSTTTTTTRPSQKITPCHFLYTSPLLQPLIWLKIASLAALQRSLEGVDSLWHAMRLIYTSRAHKFHQATLNNARSTSESHPAPATPPSPLPPPPPAAVKRRQLNRLLPCRLARTLGPDIALVEAVDSIILMRLGDLLHWRRLAKADRHTHTHSTHPIDILIGISFCLLLWRRRLARV